MAVRKSLVNITGQIRQLPDGDILTGSVFVNVQEYGAIGDGITDDTAAIQAAINASANRTIYVPAGTYLISDTLTFNAKPCIFEGAAVKTDNNNNTTADGGSVLYLKDSTNKDLILVTDTSGGRQGNVLIRHLVLEGNKTNNSSGNGIVIDSVRLVTIEKCRIRRFKESGIHTLATYSANGVNICIIQNNEILYNDSRGIRGTVLGDSFILGNSIGVSGSQGITVSGGVQISNNHVYLSGANGIAIAGNGSVVLNNRVANSTQDGINISGATHSIVVGNTVENNNQGATSKSGISIATSTNLIVVGNNCFDDQGSPTQTYGIEVKDTTSTGVIQNNHGSGNVMAFFLLPTGHSFDPAPTTWRDTWSSATTYAQSDIVIYVKHLWVSKTTNTASPPYEGSSDWSLVCGPFNVPTFPEDWTGYAAATPDNPSETETDFSFQIDLSQLPADFWTAVLYDGRDIRVTDSTNTLFPIDAIHIDKAGNTGLLIFKATKTTTNQTYRVWAGANLTTKLAATDTLGQYNAYASHVKAFFPDGGGNDRTSTANNLTMTGSPTVGGVSGPYTSTLGTDYNGTTQFGTATASVPTADPMSILLWGNSDDDTISRIAANIGTGATTIESALQFAGAVANNPIRTIRNNSGVATTTAGFTQGTWAQAAVVFTSTTSRTAYINGGNSGSNATSLAAGTATGIFVGASGGAIASFFDGKLSLVSVHNIALAASWISYHNAMGNQSTFWNGWAWSNDTNETISTYAAGTAYQLTATPVAIDFGTTDPAIILSEPGTYRICGFAVVDDNGATFSASRTATLKLRRTNNTAGDLTNGSVAVKTQIVTTVTGTLAVVYWEAADYVTTNYGDAITIFGDISVAPSAGSLDVSQAFIKAFRVA